MFGTAVSCRRAGTPAENDVALALPTNARPLDSSKNSKEEGVHFLFNAQPVELVGSDRVEGVKIVDNPKIFAGGDMVRGSDLVVTAVFEGREAAKKNSAVSRSWVRAHHGGASTGRGWLYPSFVPSAAGRHPLRSAIRA